MRTDGRDVQLVFVLVHVGQEKRDDPVVVHEVQHEIGTSESIRYVPWAQFRVAQTIVLDELEGLQFEFLPERSGFGVHAGEPFPHLERGVPRDVDTCRNLDAGRPSGPIRIVVGCSRRSRQRTTSTA